MKSVRGAHIKRAVEESDPKLLRPFIGAAKELEKVYGVRAITTSCGFLSIFQEELAKTVGIPLFTSNLLMVPVVHRMTQRRVGIITADSDHLTMRHMRGAGVDGSVPVALTGLQDQPEWGRVHSGKSETADLDRIRKEVLGVAAKLKAGHPDIGSVVLECHNLAPYAAAISEALRVPVFDIISFVRYLYYAVVPKRHIGFL
jgi:Asp/Glu/hydantoin racemase